MHFEHDKRNAHFAFEQWAVRAVRAVWAARAAHVCGKYRENMRAHVRHMALWGTIISDDVHVDIGTHRGILYTSMAPLTRSPAWGAAAACTAASSSLSFLSALPWNKTTSSTAPPTYRSLAVLSAWHDAHNTLMLFRVSAPPANNGMAWSISDPSSRIPKHPAHLCRCLAKRRFCAEALTRHLLSPDP